ncbi:MAG TPA: nicotinate-nucleotide adenylyltransferase [Limnochordales bacterium]
MRAPRIGLMGGTFDPIHYGHLVTAEGARVEFALDKVFFVPSGRPPHKPADEVTPAEHRYLMTVLATLGNPYFEVSRLDIDRPGPSYTVETIEEARRLWGASAQLFFITGADAILEILTWKDPERLLSSCHFIAATRPGYDLGRLEGAIGDLWRRFSHRIHVVQVPAMSISSSDIRERVRRGYPIRYLVPEAVADYIYKYRLYQAPAQGAGAGEGGAAERREAARA